VEQPAGVEVNPGEEAVLACRLQGKKGDCRLGYSDFHNLVGFTSKKMPKIIFLKMFVKKVFQLVEPFLANLHYTCS
jgi:hypothetical protein